MNHEIDFDSNRRGFTVVIPGGNGYNEVRQFLPGASRADAESFARTIRRARREADERKAAAATILAAAYAGPAALSAITGRALPRGESPASAVDAERAAVFRRMCLEPVSDGAVHLNADGTIQSFGSKPTAATPPSIDRMTGRSSARGVRMIGVSQVFGGSSK